MKKWVFLIISLLLVLLCITVHADGLTGVQLSATSLSLNYGDFYLLKATPIPANVKLKPVLYSYSHHDHCYFENCAYYAFTATRDCTINMTLEDVDGNKASASCAVKVNNEPTDGFQLIECDDPTMSRGCVLTVDAHSQIASFIQLINGTLNVRYRVDEFPVRLLLDNVDGSPNFDILMRCYDENKHLIMEEDGITVKTVPQITSVFPYSIPEEKIPFEIINTIEEEMQWSIAMNICSEFSWRAESDSSWLKLSKTSGTGSATITATADGKPASGQRIAHVIVYGNGWIKDLTFTQGNPEPVAFKVINDGQEVQSFDLHKDAGVNEVYTVTVTSNTEWTAELTNESENFVCLAKADESPAAIISDTSAKGDANTTQQFYVKIVTLPADGGTSTASITFTVGDEQYVYKVTQTRSEASATSTPTEEPAAETSTVTPTPTSTSTSTETSTSTSTITPAPTHDEALVDFQVIQDGKKVKSLKLNKDDGVNAVYTVQVTSKTKWTATLTNESEDFVRLMKADKPSATILSDTSMKGAANKTLQFCIQIVTLPESGKTSKASITFKVGKEEYVFPITQTREKEQKPVEFSVKHGDTKLSDELKLGENAGKDDYVTLTVNSNTDWKVKLTNETKKFLKIVKVKKSSAEVDSETKAHGSADNTYKLRLQIGIVPEYDATSKANLVFTVGKEKYNYTILLIKPAAEPDPTVKLSVSPSSVNNSGKTPFKLKIKFTNTNEFQMKIDGLKCVEKYIKEKGDGKYKETWNGDLGDVGKEYSADEQEMTLTFYPKKDSTPDKYTIEVTVVGKSKKPISAKADIEIVPVTKFSVTHAAKSLPDNTLTLSEKASKGAKAILQVDSNRDWTVTLKNTTKDFVRLVKSDESSATIVSETSAKGGADKKLNLTIQIVTLPEYDKTSTAELSFKVGGETKKYKITMTRTDNRKLPTVVTLDAENVKKTSAKVGLKITGNGGCEIKECGIYWGYSEKIMYEYISFPKNPEKGKEYKEVINNLESGNRVYYKAYARNEKGSTYGNVKYFDLGGTAKSISISGSTVVAKNKFIRLRAKVEPDGVDSAVDWKSSDETIATVDLSGFVTGIKKGKVTITAVSRENNKVSKSVTVEVFDKAVNKIKFGTTTAKMVVGESLDLQPEVKPLYSTSQLGWSISDKNLARMNYDSPYYKQIIYAKNVGTFVVTAKAIDAEDSTVEASITITVYAKDSEYGKKRQQIINAQSDYWTREAMFTSSIQKIVKDVKSAAEKDIADEKKTSNDTITNYLNNYIGVDGLDKKTKAALVNVYAQKIQEIRDSASIDTSQFKNDTKLIQEVSRMLCGNKETFSFTSANVTYVVEIEESIHSYGATLQVGSIYKRVIIDKQEQLVKVSNLIFTDVDKSTIKNSLTQLNEYAMSEMSKAWDAVLSASFSMLEIEEAEKALKEIIHDNWFVYLIGKKPVLQQKVQEGLDIVSKMKDLYDAFKDVSNINIDDMDGDQVIAKISGYNKKMTAFDDAIKALEQLK